jgi:hypothetical protein
MQYALIREGQLVTERDGLPVISNHGPVENHKFGDGCRWLPVQTTDEREFHPGKHWRLKPRYEVERNRVLRVYPIVEATP